MKKWLKTILWAFIGMVFFMAGMAVYGYSKYFERFKKNEEKYPQHIGYLDSSNPDMSSKFRRCNPDLLPAGFYSSAFTYAFESNPSKFKEAVIPKFNSQSNYNHSGFLGIRFIIDCNGNIGDYEINALDVNYERTTFEKEMIHTLLQLCLAKEHWKGRNTIDTYMYLILKIENGQILEIIP